MFLLGSGGVQSGRVELYLDCAAMKILPVGKNYKISVLMLSQVKARETNKMK